ncbi:Dimethylaniline monooxygenase [N-oxide-forming] 5 [Fusarium culmorum]|uniref:Dimethylaniline monooxygenase [N-oxide-forming] 5 n=1 Tax=Fusarium culmorum TaxID=5516 RepID=A0A2T4GYP0_FUSCU|nr:Dimethylaniline monooxygenase [N-oxide-forming] 5 [Fusarium culmorum]
MMSRASVAVIGAGPTGITMLKQLLQDGFNATLFERRSQVGGLWAFDAKHGWTSALDSTTANISKYTCGFTDYPIPDRYPVHLTPADFQEFMQGYAEHFGLLKHITFDTSVKVVNRNKEDNGWDIQVENVESGQTDTRHFDKVAFCHGYQTVKKMPIFPGQDNYKGDLMHAQQYRSPESFKDKTVVILGLSTTTDDIAPQVVSVAKKVYISHRSGQIVVRRFRKGTPSDLLVSWRRRVISQWIAKNLPNTYRFLANTLAKLLSSQMAGMKLDPAWRLKDFKDLTLSLPGIIENTLPLLKDGSVTSLHGIKRFTGGKSIEFEDGTIIDDVDSVIFTTGYQCDFSPAPFVEKSIPKSPNYGGPSIHRLYMNVFPPKYADSCVMLCYSAYGKNNGFSFSDVMNMAISNIWRGVSDLPSHQEMEEWVDHHHEWLASNWAREPTVDLSMVKQYEFQPWMHKQAGTGMENLGWGWAGWKFWWKDRKMYNLMNHGVETAHMFRFFETGMRSTWDGARDEIIRQNKIVKEAFGGKKNKTRSD